MYSFNKNQITLGLVIVFILSVMIYLMTESHPTAIIFAVVAFLSILVLSRKNPNEIDRILSEDFKNYDFSGRPRVVVSFTTIPSRTQFIPTVINKLRKQSFKPDMIYVNVPYHSKRLDKMYTLPDDLNLGSDVKIVRCEDFGPATKLLGAIPEESDPDTCIITIDDDQDYHEDTLKILVAYSMKYPDKVISLSSLGLDLRTSVCPMNKNIKSPEAFYAEGFCGVLYKRGFITDEMLSYFQNLSFDCFLSDDLTISTWMEIQGIDRIRVCDFEFINTTIDREIDKNDALHRFKRKTVYNNCSREMEKWRSLKLLERVTKVLDDNKIQYWLDFTTLLGAVKQGDLLDNDIKINIGVFIDEQDKIVKLLEEELPRYKIIIDGKYDEYISIKNPNSVYTHINIYGYSKKGDYIHIENCTEPRPKEWMFPLETISIKGIEFKIPQSHSKVLEAEYGQI